MLSKPKFKSLYVANYARDLEHYIKELELYVLKLEQDLTEADMKLKACVCSWNYEDKES